MAVFGSGQQVRVRKFCTSAGSTLYHYLLLFPGASFCQNMNVVFHMLCTKWFVDSPPAPPSQMRESRIAHFKYELNGANRLSKGGRPKASID
ncbi:hypothetical protein OSTOST_08856 [Ostertagia ostertagi]